MLLGILVETRAAVSPAFPGFRPGIGGAMRWLPDVGVIIAVIPEVTAENKDGSSRL